MLRTSSSTSRMRRPSNTASRCARLPQHPLAFGRQRRLDLVQEQRDLVEQALGRARALDDDRARVAAQARSSSRVRCGRCRRSPAGTRCSPRRPCARAGRSPSRRAAQVDHHAVEGRLGQRLEASAAGRRRRSRRRSSLQQLARLSRWAASSSTISSAAHRLREAALSSRSSASRSSSRVAGLST